MMGTPMKKKPVLAALPLVIAMMFTLSCTDADDASLDGYWDLTSFYDSGFDTTTPVTSGTAVIHFHGGSHEYYYDMGTPGCTLGTYTVDNDLITYNTSTVDRYRVSDMSLRLTTVTGGPPFNNDPGDYSDFIRLTSFDPAPYGACH